jgi:hypothetical protein
LLADFLILFLRCKRENWLNYSVLSAWGLITVFILGEAMYSSAIGLPWIIIAAGLRIFEYVPLMFIGVIVFRVAGEAPFRAIARVLLVYLAIQTVAGALEITILPTIFGSRTRAYGTLPGPIVFGITVAVCALFAMVARLRPLWPVWAVSAAMAVASGTRMAMLMLMGLVGVKLITSIKNLYMQTLAGLICLVVSPAMFLLVNSPILSGREQTEAGGLQRFEVWQRIVETIQTVPDLLFGWGMGLGSNTVFALLGEFGYPGQYIADGLIPFIIGSYGIIGVILQLMILCVYFWRVRQNLDGIVVGVVFLLASITTVSLEVFPVNAMLFILLGWQWARCSKAIPLNGVFPTHSPCQLET